MCIYLCISIFFCNFAPDLRKVRFYAAFLRIEYF